MINNKSISIINPSTKEIINTDIYFLITEDTRIYFPNIYAYYYFNKYNIILCLNLGTGLCPMNTYVEYIYDINNDIIYNNLKTIFDINKFKDYFLYKILININKINKFKLYELNTNIEKKITTIYGYNINIGHLIFNDYSGLYILDKSDMVKNIDEIILGDFDPFNIDIYFKNKNKNINIIYESNLKKYNNYIGKGCIFKYNHHFISNNVVIFFKKNLIEYNIDDNNLIDIKKHYPIVNIVLRCGNRMMKNQDIIISNFINEFIIKYPNSYFYFDGFIRNKNNKTKLSFNNYNYDTMRDNYITVVNSIIDKINTKNYKSLINLYPSEIIKYLEVSNVALYNCGSGCILSGWICNIPGIEYGVPHVKIYEKMDKCVKENMCKIEYNDDVKYNFHINSEDLDFTLNFNLNQQLQNFIDHNLI